MHFRKTLIKQKIGSQRNGFTVIQKSGYQVAYYEHENEERQDNCPPLLSGASVGDGYGVGLLARNYVSRN